MLVVSSYVKITLCGNVKLIESDIAITRKIKESGIVMDIQLLDHLIIVPDGNYSMGDEGII
jgi:DNA repair protein RadC